MSDQPSRYYIAYRSEKECYRIKADDYQVFDSRHFLYMNDYIVGSFPLIEGWVVMLDEYVENIDILSKLILEYLEYKEGFDPFMLEDITEEELIKMWFNQRNEDSQ
ncbi:hypothetical protein [Aquimarina macrocephali]|uniref:hypothetical protein n=1 Tax=Aquimarina macrocephali TaxID=666563 RepID=UPI003F666166